ncbi:phosphotransferase [Nonomuraea sp. NPDC049684]|uniref:phosphotransferase n=1 Tax=Nonomuraea sp. NPDC049684 TaxID=3364356 RepID=UPI0037BE1697
MEIGELLGTGRTADVYAIGPDRVLRRNRLPADTRREAAVMAHVAACGYPVPRVYPGGHGPADLVMERLAGPTMLHALLTGRMRAGEAGTMLARLLRRLHELPARTAADPGHRVLHLDLHPDNVMLTPRGPMVIDWSNAEDGPPALDRAMSAVILAEVAVQPATGIADVAQAVLGGLLAGLGDVLPEAEHLAAARARREANPTLSAAEVAALGAAVGEITRLAAALG